MLEDVLYAAMTNSKRLVQKKEYYLIFFFCIVSPLKITILKLLLLLLEKCTEIKNFLAVVYVAWNW